MLRYLLIIIFSVSCSSVKRAKVEHLNNQSPASIKEYQGIPRQLVTILVEGLPNRIPMEDQGLIPIIGKILDKGPSDLSEKDYKRQLFLMNAEISFSSQYRAVYITVTAPPQNLAKALDLLNRTLKKPKFHRKLIVDAIQSTKANLEASFSNMRNAFLYFSFKDFFDFHPSTRNGTTSPRYLSKIKWNEVESLYKKYFKMEHLRIYSTGPVANSELMSVLNNKVVELSTPYKAYQFRTMTIPSLPKNKVKIIHRPGVTDHQVLFVYPHNIRPDSEEGLSAQIVFDYFGGGLTGRLGSILREQRGLTYHVSANKGENLPVWYIYSFAGSKQIEGLLSGIQEVKESVLNESISSEKVSLSKKSLITGYRSASELPIDSLYAQIHFDLFNYDLGYFYNYERYLNGVSTSDVNKIKKKLLGTKHFQLYLMGDKKVLVPVLQKIGLGDDIEIIDESKI